MESCLSPGLVVAIGVSVSLVLLATAGFVWLLSRD